MEQKNTIDAEKGIIWYKGKEFRFLVIPLFIRSAGELKHWLRILDEPENFKEFIGKVFDEMERKKNEPPAGVR